MLRIVVALVVVVCAVVVVPARAQTPREQVEALLDEVWPDRPRHPAFTDPVSPDSPNAAGRYLYWLPKLDKKLADLAGWLDTEKLAFAFPEWAAEHELPGTIDDLRRELVAQQEWIRAIVETTRVERFDMHYAAGLVFDVPVKDVREGHLATRRQTQRVLRADAVRLWLDGKHAEAGDRLVAMFGLAVHFADQPSPMIDQLVAESLLRYACDTAKLMLAEGQPELPAAQHAALVKVLSKVDGQDPAGCRAGWNALVDAKREFVRQQTANGEVGEPLLAMWALEQGAAMWADGLFKGFLAGKVEVPKGDDEEMAARAEELGAKLELLTHERIMAEAAKAEELVARARKVWEDDDAIEHLREIQSEVRDDDTGMREFLVVHPRSLQPTWRQSVTNVADVKKLLLRQQNVAE